MRTSCDSSLLLVQLRIFCRPQGWAGARLSEYIKKSAKRISNNASHLQSTLQTLTNELSQKPYNIDKCLCPHYRDGERKVTRINHLARAPEELTVEEGFVKEEFLAKHVGRLSFCFP